VLLEREQTQVTLARAVADAAEGRGSVVLVTGEAGIGKTSLIRAFAADVPDDTRLLLSACDDLMASRTLGPLRDAVLGHDPVLDPFAALLDELAGAAPTVLVVEDIHWADDATLDVLGYAARRIEFVGAVLVLTFRDDEIDAHHPLHRFLGTLAGCPVHRIALAPLSRAAVGRLSEGTPIDPAALHRATRGNPFFVTEVLASPDAAVPASVMQAVLARAGRVSAESRDALDQLSVIPGHVDRELATELLGCRHDALAEAELAGVIEVRADTLAFRHELARRAIEQALPELRRQQLNARVVAALQAAPRPVKARLMHHAVQARDIDTGVAVGPSAGREAALAGSHRQALAHYESVLPHAARLSLRVRAAQLDSYGWALYNALRFRDAVDAGRAAAALYEELGDPVALGGCLVRLSRHLFMAGETDAAEDRAHQAVAILEPTGDAAAQEQQAAVDL
jgi:hypothetical protein